MDIAIWIILGLVVIAGLWLWATYNGLVTLKVRVDEAWSDITIQLKRRADLIPNLIETVRGYATHEREVFESVTRARAATVSPEANLYWSVFHTTCIKGCFGASGILFYNVFLG